MYNFSCDKCFNPIKNYKVADTQCKTQTHIQHKKSAKDKLSSWVLFKLESFDWIHIVETSITNSQVLGEILWKCLYSKLAEDKRKKSAEKKAEAIEFAE